MKFSEAWKKNRKKYLDGPLALWRAKWNVYSPIKKFFTAISIFSLAGNFFKTFFKSLFSLGRASPEMIFPRGKLDVLPDEILERVFKEVVQNSEGAEKFSAYHALRGVSKGVTAVLKSEIQTEKMFLAEDPSLDKAEVAPVLSVAETWSAVKEDLKALRKDYQDCERLWKASAADRPKIEDVYPLGLVLNGKLLRSTHPYMKLLEKQKVLEEKIKMFIEKHLLHAEETPGENAAPKKTLKEIILTHLKSLLSLKQLDALRPIDDHLEQCKFENEFLVQPDVWFHQSVKKDEYCVYFPLGYEGINQESAKILLKALDRYYPGVFEVSYSDFLDEFAHYRYNFDENFCYTQLRINFDNFFNKLVPVMMSIKALPSAQPQPEQAPEFSSLFAPLSVSVSVIAAGIAKC